LARRLGATERQIELLLNLGGEAQAALAGFPPECIGTAPTERPPDPAVRPESPFTEADRAALAFAEQMSVGTGRVRGDVHEALAAHFDPGQIVEIAAVAGLFNYFNRFNNALEVEVTR